MLCAFDQLVVLSGISPSDWFYDRTLAERVGVQWSVIPNGVYPLDFTLEPSEPAGFRERHGIGSAPIVLYVSNYDDRKNQAAAVRAFLSAAHSDAVLVLIGSELNDYAQQVQRLYRSLAPSGLPRIIFLERQSRGSIVSAYCAANVFVCSSKWELQPLVVLDAMAASVPFISTDVGCVTEFPGGIVVRSESEMASAIAQLLGNDELRLNLGRAGRSAIESRYNWEMVGEQYEALLNRLCT
jgi:glycosyltransferase involved in cell wall biosynthesis